MKLTKRELFLISYATAKDDWTREHASIELKATESEIDSEIDRATRIEYYTYGVVIPNH
jgi:hypothetical protein